jgi:hypothetical protein
MLIVAASIADKFFRKKQRRAGVTRRTRKQSKQILHHEVIHELTHAAGVMLSDQRSICFSDGEEAGSSVSPQNDIVSNAAFFKSSDSRP